MNSSVVNRTSTARVGAAGWWLTRHSTLASTNDEARNLPPWHAVVAGSQTAGRGRQHRPFASGVGGLWLSAVLPAGGGSVKWTGLSLVVGRHLMEMLRKCGLQDLRVRWPNDLMSGSHKLGGILIEQGRSDTLVVGLGLNVTNEPWRIDPDLRNSAVRMADLMPAPPALESIAVWALDAIADAHSEMDRLGIRTTIDLLNSQWIPEHRPVEIECFSEAPVRGIFSGLDAGGNLRIALPDGGEKVVGHHHVSRLREISRNIPSINSTHPEISHVHLR